jgi:hypothetical protein
MAPGLGPDRSVGWGSTDRSRGFPVGVSGHVATTWMVEAHGETDGTCQRNAKKMMEMLENRISL